MKIGYLLFTVILATILCFGCVGGDQTQDTVGSSQSPVSGDQDPGQTTGTGTPATETPDAASITTYGAAVATGIPLECTAVMNQETTKFWIKGEKMYISGTQGGRSFEGILKDNDMYMKLTAEDKASYAQIGLTCDWLLFKGDENESSSSASSIDTTSYEGPNVKWSCTAGLFGDEKFETSGNACTGEDLANAMFPGGSGQ
jgi:hypothetical protein